MNTHPANYWAVKALYVPAGTTHHNSLAAAKAAVIRGGMSARIDYEGRPLMFWCPISGWSEAK